MRIINASFVIIVLFILQFTARFAGDFWGPSAQRFTPTQVNIPPRTSARRIGFQLAKNNIVPSPAHFLISAKVQGIERSLNPGTFKFYSSRPVWEIAKRIATTRPDTVWVTIPEGYTLEKVAKVLEDSTGISFETFLSAAKDPAFIHSMNIQADSLQGYLFPDSYELATEWSAEQILREMARQFKLVWSSLHGTWSPEEILEIAGMGFQPHEIVTVASIIEREGLFPSEYPRIAGVFFNRLEKNMRLESCATVRFILKDWRKPLYYKDLRIDSPYNTYRNEGLPPGPICNPGRISLQAALQPLDTGELYFVAGKNGWHEFSKTHKEHVRAKRRLR